MAVRFTDRMTEISVQCHIACGGSTCGGEERDRMNEISVCSRGNIALNDSHR